MKAAISPVSVFPGSATQLQVNETFTGRAGAAPFFDYALLDASNQALKIGQVAMTVNQWNDWEDNVPDATYILSCVSTNLGLTLT